MANSINAIVDGGNQLTGEDNSLVALGGEGNRIVLAGDFNPDGTAELDAGRGEEVFNIFRMARRRCMSIRIPSSSFSEPMAPWRRPTKRAMRSRSPRSLRAISRLWKAACSKIRSTLVALHCSRIAARTHRPDYPISPTCWNIEDGHAGSDPEIDRVLDGYEKLALESRADSVTADRNLAQQSEITFTQDGVGRFDEVALSADYAGKVDLLLHTSPESDAIT
ncbi:MAG: hypothetical protein U5O39_11745 [Gammaproteobacteria bacterium]|nr:hypothetical protein [Gammaproteobacteria bacterium]